MCVYMCVCVCVVCVCVFVCVCVCVYAEGQSYGTLHLAILVPMYRVDVFQFLFIVIAERGCKEYGVKILTTNSSLVNGTSNTTQM